MTQFLIAMFVTFAALYACFNPYVFARLLHLVTNQDGFMAQRINRTDPERWFITVYNTYATAALSNGQAVMWDYPTDADGIGVTRPTARATSGGSAGAGIVAEAIASGGYGLMQVYGYHSAVRMRTVTGGSPAIVAGRPLVMPVAGSVFCLESVSTASNTILTQWLGFSLGATAGFTTSAKAAFIKAL